MRFAEIAGWKRSLQSRRGAVRPPAAVAFSAAARPSSAQAAAARCPKTHTSPARSGALSLRPEDRFAGLRPYHT
jgi:hypothetical protein